VYFFVLKTKAWFADSGLREIRRTASDNSSVTRRPTRGVNEVKEANLAEAGDIFNPDQGGRRHRGPHLRQPG
jgi:hypothetical protein